MYFLNCNRFIPARAGNSQAAQVTVHPRACGEQARADGRDVSSIPARAGTVRSPSGHRVNTVHPRACGEQRVTASMLKLRFIAAGNRLKLFIVSRARRFIPARAGNSAMKLAVRSTESVHPRACGEQRAFTLLLVHLSVHPRACGEQFPST